MSILETDTDDSVTLWVESCSLEVPYSCPTFIHFARQRCYYGKIFNLVITIICTEEPSGESSYRPETSQLICFASRLVGFRYCVGFC